MVPQRVILYPGSKLGCYPAMLSGSHLPVMHTHLLSKGPGLPSLHPRRDDRNMIDASAPNRHVPANVLEALPPKQLAATPHILNVTEAVVILIATLAKRCPHHAELRIPGELCHQK